jgi:1,4-dihydroxy-2-naphthoate octaprenyltransferase
MAWLAQRVGMLLPLLLLPSALNLRRAFKNCAPGTAFNQVLFRTFRLELWFAALLSLGALLGRAVG